MKHQVILYLLYILEFLQHYPLLLLTLNTYCVYPHGQSVVLIQSIRCVENKQILLLLVQ